MQASALPSAARSCSALCLQLQNPAESSPVRRSMIEVYRLSGTKIHHPISDLDLLFLPSFHSLKIDRAPRLTTRVNHG
jgi:hypothetical protein